MRSLVFLILVVWQFSAQAQVKLSKKQLTKGVSMSIPQNFVLANDDLLARKYFSPKKPTAVYTDPNAQVDVGINFTESYWHEDDIPMLKDLYRASLSATYTRVEFLKETVEYIHKRQYVVFEFVGILEDEAKENAVIEKRRGRVEHYNYLMYTVVNKKIVVANFNCPAKMRNAWQEQVPKMMQSLRIKNLDL